MRVRRLAASPNSPKSFRGHGVFLGEITDISPERWYTVKYSEGDFEEVSGEAAVSSISRYTREEEANKKEADNFFARKIDVIARPLDWRDVPLHWTREVTTCDVRG